jgi:hypothetical protein
MPRLEPPPLVHGNYGYAAIEQRRQQRPKLINHGCSVITAPNVSDRLKQHVAHQQNKRSLLI